MPAKQSIGQATQTTRKPLPKPGPEEAKEQQQSGGRSRAAAFDEAPEEKGFNFPVGEYFADLIEINVLRDGNKESVQFKFAVTEGEQAEKEVSCFFNFFNEEGEEQRGMGFFKKAVSDLSHDPAEFVEAYKAGEQEFEDALKSLAEEQLPCVVLVKANKGYTNVYLQGLAQQ